MGKPTVFLIRISDNPASMWYAGITYQSWTTAGYSVQIVEAVTPKSMKEQPFRLTFSEKKLWGRSQRPFTETEKAVFYSHMKVWGIAARKAHPSIIVEHDGVLIDRNIPRTITRHDIVTLERKWPAVAYHIKPHVAAELHETLRRKTLVGNLDAYVWNRMLQNDTPETLNIYRHSVLQHHDKSVGNTIEHPDYEYATKVS